MSKNLSGLIFKPLRRHIKIKQKIILALVFVSLFLVISMTSIGLIITRSIIAQNSMELTNDYVKQISLNMDERIKSFEDATYIISKQIQITNLLTEQNKKDNAAEKQRKEAGLNDIILQNPSIHKYTRYAFVESIYDQRYVYKKYEENAIPEEVIDKNKLIAMGKVNKTNPIRWIEIDGNIVFIRLVINEKTFDIQGIMCFCMVETFFNFTNTQNDIISDNDFIIMNNWNDVMYSGEYDINNTSIQNLVTKRLLKYDVKNRNIQYNGKRIIVSEILTQTKQWRILCLIKVDELFRRDKIVILFNILFALVAFLISIIFTIAISKGIVENIKRIQICMNEVEQGNFNTRMKPANYDEIGLLGLRFNYMVNKMKDLLNSLSKERIAKQDAEFKALQAQINPHFLYNSLGSVKWMANRYKQKDIEKMIDAIISLLKGSIKTSNSFQTLQDEINYLMSYVELQKMRYGDTFIFIFNIMPETLKAVIPGFLLQPLVENSLYHGIDMTENNGEIAINSFIREGMLVLQVVDNGIGITEEKIKEIFSQPEKSAKYKGFNRILIISGTNLAFSTMMYIGFVKTIPLELEEAAYIEGYDKFRIFTKIVLPLLSPITYTIVTLSALWTWNEFNVSLIVLQKDKIKTIPMQQYVFFSQYNSKYNLAFAAAIITMIPIVIFFISVQKYIIKGLSEGAIKG